MPNRRGGSTAAFCSGLLFLGLATVCRALEAPAAIAAWASRQARPLVGLDLGSGFKDLELLKRLIGSARVVRLGEAGVQLQVQRGAAQADNVRWILEQEGPQGRVLNLRAQHASEKRTGRNRVAFAGHAAGQRLGSSMVVIGSLYHDGRPAQVKSRV